MITRLTFIAHAPTEALRRAAFPFDEPVLQRELERTTELGWRAPRAQRVLSAPEQRTQLTAQALGLSATNSVELRDCDYGVWRGRTMGEVQADDPEGILTWLTDPSSSPHGGESIEKLIGRVGRWIEEQGNASHTIAVTHPAVIRAAIVYALRIPAEAFWRFDIAPLSQTDLRFNGRVWTMRCAGCSLPTRDETRARNAALEE